MTAGEALAHAAGHLGLCAVFEADKQRLLTIDEEGRISWGPSGIAAAAQAMAAWSWACVAIDMHRFDCDVDDLYPEM